MTKIFCFAVLFTIIGAATIFAADIDPGKLSGWEKEGNLSSVGMCDSMRSPFFRLSGETYTELVAFDPVSNSHKRFYVVAIKDGKEFFVREMTEGKLVARKLSPMEWSQELVPESVNFFHYIFFPEKPTDCSESKQN